MDKELKNKNKMDSGGKDKPVVSPAAPDFSSATIGAYNPELTQKAWDENKKPWNATPHGRLAIRAFSRGVLGAAFFAGGGLLNRKWMEGYHIDQKWGEQTNPLKFIAKLIDTTAGKGIKVTVNALGGNGARAVRFRPTRYHGSLNPWGGHSLGEETVGVTFDFFCASVGDAWGRDIAGWFDPSVKKKWMKDGHVDFPQAVKQAVKSVAQYVTYNGGEDWAVAIPYVYFVRGHRALLNRFSPGFRYDSDRVGSGGGLKINNKLNFVGNFNQEGIVDLQNRFVVYNMGTLMFRELWDYFAKKLKGEQAVLYGDPDPEHYQKKGLLGSIAAVPKWFARAVVKAGIYMQFAVPFFWITRTPQSKYRGAFIHPGKGMLAYEDEGIDAHGRKTVEVRIVHADEHTKGYGYNGETPLYFAQYNRNGDLKEVRDAGYKAGQVGLGLDKSRVYQQTFDLADKGLNAIGRFNNQAAEAAAEKMIWVRDHTGWAGRKIENYMGHNTFSKFGRDFVNASFSYTPYMYMKAETARLWDNAKMDMATERMIDGASHFSWGEFKAGVGEVWRAFLHQPFADSKREEKADKREAFNTSLTDSVNLDQWEAQMKQRRNGGDKLNWRERVLQGEKPEIGANDPKSHAEREEMREALKNLQPPTPSIN